MKSNDQKRTEANERQRCCDERSDMQQRDVLDARLGDGVGAKRERTKIVQRREGGAT